MENIRSIKIKGLKIYANHGVYEDEKINGQYFYIDADLKTDLCKPSYSDKLEDSLNYADVCIFIDKYVKTNTFDLIEKLGYELSKELLLRYESLNEVNITIHKPEAPIGLPVEDISVDINNKWNLVYLGIGSNIGERIEFVNQALCKLSNHPAIKDVKMSKLIETEPYGYTDQDKFINGAIELKTILNPFELLDLLHIIEKDAGRERLIHWGPRTLDLDILMYEDYLIDSKELSIPHIDMGNREFVLKPLLELCEDRINVRTDKTIKEMYTELMNGED